MNNKQIEELLDNWSDCYWQSMLLAKNCGDEEYEALFRSLAYTTNQVALMMRGEKHTMRDPAPVTGYEQYKYGEWPE
jgi:hypothetical protein